MRSEEIKEENMRFAEQHGIPFIDADYDSDNWFERARGMEKEPERGIRCTMCFDMRFERTALYAFEHGFSAITSCLGISRWKDMQQITGCGVPAAAPYPGMVEISKRERFYHQEYCGCVYSLRDSNLHRKSRGRDLIKLGVKYYGDENDQ